MTAFALCLAALLLTAGSAWAGFEVRQWIDQRTKKVQAAKFQLVISDPDAIPIRQDALSAEGVSRLIHDINAGLYR